MKKFSTGFTLIELLIVVAIIAILAAIAIPNFLQAQTRAKVSRAEADMRALSTALETYYVDHNTYPPGHHEDGDMIPYDERLNPLTTPIAYVTSIPMDPFQDSRPGWSDYDLHQGHFDYWPMMYIDPPRYHEVFGGPITWQLLSPGPDGVFVTHAPPEGVEIVDWSSEKVTILSNTVYDPTNGTISTGDIWRIGGQ